MTHLILCNKFNVTNARIGLKSNPKIGGMIPRNKFKYGSVIANTGCNKAIPCA